MSAGILFAERKFRKPTILFLAFGSAKKISPPVVDMLRRTQI
jgi:hypothetical protein